MVIIQGLMKAEKNHRVFCLLQILERANGSFFANLQKENKSQDTVAEILSSSDFSALLFTHDAVV